MLPVRNQKRDDVDPFPERDARRDRQAAGIDRFPHLDLARIVIERHQLRDGVRRSHTVTVAPPRTWAR